MKQITRWGPDTCECVIEYEWDDAVPDSQRTHTISKIVSKCSAHSKLSDGETHFLNVLDENTTKNKAFEIVKSKAPTLDPDNFKYSFDKDRKLVVDVANLGLKASDKTTLLSDLDTKLGTGKVSVK
jgi:hypothetical protein